MTDPTYRMSMLPLGTYANPDGTESLGLAVPGMIQEPVNALMRLFGSGNFAQGPDYGSNADDMRTLLFSMYGGNALNPGRLVESAGLKDAAQAAYRTARHPFETAVSDIPAPELSNQLSNWPLPTPAAARREGRLGYDMVDELRVPNAGQTWHNMRADFPRGGASNDIDTGPLDVGYLNAILRQRKVDDGALFSDTGKPSLMGSAIAAESAPQRMYHGTGVPDDFTTFRPSDGGSFGAGVYFSTEPHVAADYANTGPNPRIIPADVTGPFASDWDFWDAYDKNGGDSAAAIQALLDQGYSGVSMDAPGARGKINVTNVFRPGSVTSPLTGETLFSDGLPSLWGNALAPSQEPRNALMDYAQNDQSHMWDHRDQPPVEDYQSVLPSDMNQFRLNWMRQYRSSHPGSGPEDAYDAYLKSPEYKEKLKGSKQIPFDQISPGEFIPHR